MKLSTEERHEATHIIDDGCCIVIEACTLMIEAVSCLDLEAELQAIVDATRALHQRASVEHERFAAGSLQ